MYACFVQPAPLLVSAEASVSSFFLTQPPHPLQL
jgi:hypothetical protein